LEAAPERPVEAAPEEAEPTEAEAKLQAGAEVSTIRRAKSAGMSLGKQKAARKAIRKLAGDLEEAPEERWVGILTAALTAEIEIFHYIRAVTVYAALAEAQVEAELAERIVAALQASEMIPADTIPYDEEDFARFEAAQAAQEETPQDEGGSDAD
jgi:hypothetical protein